MSDLIPYRSRALSARQRDQIQHLTEATKAVQQEVGRIYTEGTKLAVETLTYTTERIQAAAQGGMSDDQVAALVAEQQQYLMQMRQLAAQGAGGVTSLLRNLPALPGG
jgi:hypothetical protein